MLIPTKCIITDMSEVKDGETGIECTVCKRKFSVPSEDAKKFVTDETVVCEDCSSVADKTAALTATVSAKMNDAVETIKTALGK